MQIGHLAMATPFKCYTFENGRHIDPNIAQTIILKCQWLYKSLERTGGAAMQYCTVAVDWWKTTSSIEASV